MIKSFIPLCFLILATVCGTKEKKSTADLSIVPIPAKISAGDGMIEWEGNVAIIADGEGAASAEFISEFFKTKGIEVSQSPAPQSINLSIVSDSTLGKEGYTLSINDKGVFIKANEGAGLFYGVQSLIQLVSTDGKQVPF